VYKKDVVEDTVQESTIQKILGDPNFDPGIILEDALVSFIRNYPRKAAEDKVALKYLVRDVDIIEQMKDVVDVNDAENLATFIDTVKRSTSWARDRALRAIVDNLQDVERENIDAVFEVVKSKLSDIRLGKIPTRFFSFLTLGQTEEMVANAVRRGSTKRWKATDWVVALRVSIGEDLFLEALEKEHVKLDADTLRIVSNMAISVKGDPVKERILLAVEDSFDGYVCFGCGKEPIKSLSGYTLHRKSCFAATVRSPHEIIMGRPKSLKFRCACGEIFTSRSGLTLHEKTCR